MPGSTDEPPRPPRTAVKAVGVDTGAARRRRYCDSVTLRRKKRQCLLADRRRPVSHTTSPGHPGAVCEASAQWQHVVHLVDSLGHTATAVCHVLVSAHAVLAALPPTPPPPPSESAALAAALCGFVVGSGDTRAAGLAAESLAVLLRASPEAAAVAAHPGSGLAEALYAAMASSKQESAALQTVAALCVAEAECAGRGGTHSTRRVLWRAGVADAIVRCLSHGPSLVSAQHAAAALCAFAELRELACDAVDRVLPAVADLLDETDEGLLQDVCWFAAFAADAGAPAALLRAATAAGHTLVVRMLDLVSGGARGVAVPCLRFLGCVAALGSAVCGPLLARNAASVLCYQVSHARRVVREEACWALSNVLEGSSWNVQMCLEAGVVPALVVAAATQESSVRREAAWALCNATVHATPVQRWYLAVHGVAPPLIACLRDADPTLQQAVLRGLLCLCSTPQAVSIVGAAVVQEGGIAVLDSISVSHTLPDEVADAAAAVLAAAEGSRGGDV